MFANWVLINQLQYRSSSYENKKKIVLGTQAVLLLLTKENFNFIYAAYNFFFIEKGCLLNVNKKLGYVSAAILKKMPEVNFTQIFYTQRSEGKNIQYKAIKVSILYDLA